MKVDLTYTYESEDISALLIVEHEKRYGKPPVGYKWVSTPAKYDCQFRIEAIQIEEPAPVVEPPAAMPTPTKEPQL